MKRKRSLIGLIIGLVIAVMLSNTLVFGTAQRALASTAGPDDGALLAEVTNCTIQTGVPYVPDLNSSHQMNVYLPVGAGLFPAFIYLHGGGWVRGNRSEYDYEGQFYAKRGIAGFSIDYTLATRNQTSWPAAIQDVISAIRFVKENAQLYHVDPEKIALMGDSAGGELASLAGLLTGNESFLQGNSGNPAVSPRVSLVVDYYGPTDFQYIGEYGVTFRTYFIIASFLGNVSYLMNQSLWLAASPASYITSHAPIFFIVHGTNDTVVPVAISDSFVSKLNADNVETHFLRIEGADHQILTSEEENLQVRYSLEPLLKKVFTLQQQNDVGFPSAIVSTVILVAALVAALVAVILFRRHLSTEKTRAASLQVKLTPHRKSIDSKTLGMAKREFEWKQVLRFKFKYLNYT